MGIDLSKLYHLTSILIISGTVYTNWHVQLALRVQYQMWFYYWWLLVEAPQL